MSNSKPPNVFPESFNFGVSHSEVNGRDKDFQHNDEMVRQVFAPLEDVHKNQTKGVAITSRTGKKTSRVHDDLSQNIRGMYRILDLINEQGSGGLVDKIIIAQESLERFINDIVPGAYTSLTKVDFKALDNVGVKPFGVYGSKDQIIEFLFSAGSIDTEIARLLTSATDDSTGPRLRSGLYLVRIAPSPDKAERVIVLYWPEDTTWNDDAISSVKRNRVTFMRYLSKIADQTLCLVSEEHAKAIVWRESSSSEEADEKVEDETDRLFTFEVAKTNEEEESVRTRPGVQIKIPTPENDTPPEYGLDLATLMPRMITGETQQGILTTSFIPPTISTLHWNEEFNSIALMSFLRDHAFLTLGDNLTEAAIGVLAEHGICNIFPMELNEWKDRNDKIREQIVKQKAAQKANLEDKISHMVEETRTILGKALVERFKQIYPTLDLSNLYPGPNAVPRTEDIEEPSHNEQFVNLVKLHPAIGHKFEELLRSKEVDKIPSKTFRTHKYRLIMVQSSLQLTANADDRQKYIDAILSERELQDLNNDTKQKWWSSVAGVFGFQEVSLKDKIMDSANKQMKDLDDSSFLASLNDLLGQEPALESTVASVVKSAQSYLTHVFEKNYDILTKIAHATQTRTLSLNTEQQCAAEERKLRLESTRAFIHLVQSKVVPDSLDVLIIELLKRRCFSARQAFHLQGRRQRHLEPQLEYKIQPITLTAHDTQNLHLDKLYVPSPKVDHRAANTFQLPLHHGVRHIQMLSNGKCLLFIDTGREFRVLCETLASLENAVGRSERGKTLHQSKLCKGYPDCVLMK